MVCHPRNVIDIDVVAIRTGRIAIDGTAMREKILKREGAHTEERSLTNGFNQSDRTILSDLRTL